MNLKRLTFGTFNLFNLNEPELAVYTDKDGWSPSEYDLKIEWTARNIALLKPDIFGFQELWHARSIARALERSGLAGDYDMLVPDDAKGKHIVSAAIVRKGLVLGEPRWIVGFPDKFILRSAGDDPQTPLISVTIDRFSGPVLHFTIKPRQDKDEVHVYVCHFKSKGPTKVFREDWFRADEATYKKHANGLGAALSTVRRTAEAAALRFILSEQMKETRTPVIVLGDINDGQHSNTVNILTEQPRYLVGESRAAATPACTRRKPCRSTGTRGTYITPTSIRTSWNR